MKYDELMRVLASRHDDDELCGYWIEVGAHLPDECELYEYIELVCTAERGHQDNHILEVNQS